MKAIGPVDVKNELPVEKALDVPFQVNRKSKTQRDLAKIIGWKRLEQIEEEEKTPFSDAQSSPVDSEKEAAPVVSPRAER